MKSYLLARLRLAMIAVASVLVVLGIFVLMAFYTRPPSAVRVIANTASIILEMPFDADSSTPLSWPISNGILCSSVDEGSFSMEISGAEQTECFETTSLTGTIWFQPGAVVSIFMRGRTQLEIQINQPPVRAGASAAILRRLTGATLELNAPARIHIPLLSSPMVFPLIGRTLQVGQEVSAQALTTRALLQHGNVSLVRRSFFGDILFSSEEFALVLGDWLRLESQGTDYVQGVLQIREGPFFDVALTASRGDAWLHRFTRDPMHLDTPLAAQLIKDPTLIILWGVLALLVGGWLRLIELRIAKSSKTS